MLRYDVTRLRHNVYYSEGAVNYIQYIAMSAVIGAPCCIGGLIPSFAIVHKSTKHQVLTLLN